MRVSQSLIGWYHIAGAIAGAAMTGWVYVSGGAVVGGSLLMAAAPFTLSWIAGVRLIREDPNAHRLAYVTQALQIPIVILPALTWKFVGGAIASVTLTLEGTRLFAGLEATWFVGSGPLGGLPAALGINTAPIIVILLLARSSGGTGKPRAEMQS